MVEFVARDLRPASVVDGCGFLNLMKVAEQSLGIPSLVEEL